MARLSLNETLERIKLLIRAGYPVIYIVSYEETRVLDYLAKIFRTISKDQPHKKFFRWYETMGLKQVTNLAKYTADEDGKGWLGIAGLPAPITEGQPSSDKTAGGALFSISAAKLASNAPLHDSLTVFFDMHQYLDPNQPTPQSLVRPLRNAADALRRYYDEQRNQPGQPYKTIVIVAPSAAALSSELERDLIVLDFPLPEVNELQQTLESMIGKVLKFPDPPPSDEVRALCGERGTADAYRSRLTELIAGAGRGLTLEDYRLGLNMFAVRGQSLSTRHIEDLLNLKAKSINTPALQYTPHVEIELGGLDEALAWIHTRREAAVSAAVREQFHLPAPKGVLLCGVSGGGKSQLAKLMAKEFNLALLRLDVGALFGQYVGESEERTRRALQLAEVLAPVVLWLDEVDKAFQGIAGGGDSGVSARVFGHFLTWLAEKQDSVFVVATANDFQRLLTDFPEFGRKGRFDEIFWVDLPDESARRAIFPIYLRKHIADGYLQLPEDAVARLAAARDLSEPQAAGALERFCSLLAHPTLSGNLTGAEIEYAITDALYQAYAAALRARDAADPLTEGPHFTPELVVDVVSRASERALYNPDSPDYARLNILRGLAREKHWIWVGLNPPADAGMAG